MIEQSVPKQLRNSRTHSWPQMDGGKREGGRHRPTDLGAGQGGLVGFLHTALNQSLLIFFSLLVTTTKDSFAPFL